MSVETQATESLDRANEPLDDWKSFARLAAAPEYGWTSGVEATTSSLGQGVATSVGMAIAERWLAVTYNRTGFDLFDHDVERFTCRAIVERHG